MPMQYKAHNGSPNSLAIFSSSSLAASFISSEVLFVDVSLLSAALEKTTDMFYSSLYTAATTSQLVPHTYRSSSNPSLSLPPMTFLIDPQNYSKQTQLTQPQLDLEMSCLSTKFDILSR